MKIKLPALFIITFLLLANISQAKKVTLKLKLHKGTTFEMNMISNNIIDQEMMGQKMRIDQKMEMTFSYQVLNILPTKNFLIEYSLVKVKMDINMGGQEVHIDSDKPDPSNPMNTSLTSLISSKLKFEMNPKGQIEKVEGLEEFSKKLGENPQMAQTMSIFMDDKSFESFVGQVFNYFPENKIKKGDKWSSSCKIPSLMNLETIMNFEVAAIEKDKISLNVKSDVNMEGKVEPSGFKVDLKSKGTQMGTMEIDPSDGWLQQSDLTQKFDVNMKMKNPDTNEEMNIPVVINSVTKITCIKIK